MANCTFVLSLVLPEVSTRQRRKACVTIILIIRPSLLLVFSGWEVYQSARMNGNSQGINSRIRHCTAFPCCRGSFSASEMEKWNPVWHCNKVCFAQWENCEASFLPFLEKKNTHEKKKMREMAANNAYGSLCGARAPYHLFWGPKERILTI